MTLKRNLDTAGLLNQGQLIVIRHGRLQGAIRQGSMWLKTYNFGELGLTVRACQTMLVPIPLVFALMAEDHLAIYLWGTHGGGVTATTRVLAAICNGRSRLTKGAAGQHFAGVEGG